MNERAVFRKSVSDFAVDALSRSGGLLGDAAQCVEDARDTDPVEAVHELRVAIRRVRSDLRIFAAAFEPHWLEATVAQLRDLGRVVGRARDLDMIFARLETTAGALPDRDRAAAAPLLRRLQSDREDARRAILAALREHARVLADLATMSADGPLAADVDTVAIEDLVAAARRQWRRLRKAVRVAQADPRAENLHRVRVRAKTLRYSLAALEPVVHRSARRHHNALVALQAHLGELQDAVVIERWLRGVLDEDRRDGFLIGELVGLEIARRERVRDTWRREWRQASRKKLCRWAH